MANLFPLDVSCLLLHSSAVVRLFFLVALLIIEVCDALRRHPACYLTRGCIIAPLLHHTEELVEVDFLIVSRVIRVSPSLAASFD